MFACWHCISHAQLACILVICFTCLSHVHVTYLTSMPRLHCIEHACLTSWNQVIEVAPLCAYLICISFDMKMHNLASWTITHWNARLMVRESSTMPLWVTNMIWGVLVHTFALNALPWPVLPSAVVKTGSEEVLAGRLHRVPTGQHRLVEISTNGRWPILHGRWQFPLAGGVPQCPESDPWELCHFQRKRAGKTEAACAWWRISEQNRARIALSPLPEAVNCFLRLVNLLN